VKNTIFFSKKFPKNEAVPRKSFIFFFFLKENNAFLQERWRGVAN
jgi:hypothetical protein